MREKQSSLLPVPASKVPQRIPEAERKEGRGPGGKPTSTLSCPQAKKNKTKKTQTNNRNNCKKTHPKSPQNKKQKERDRERETEREKRNYGKGVAQWLHRDLCSAT